MHQGSKDRAVAPRVLKMLRSTTYAPMNRAQIHTSLTQISTEIYRTPLRQKSRLSTTYSSLSVCLIALVIFLKKEVSECPVTSHVLNPESKNF